MPALRRRTRSTCPWNPSSDSQVRLLRLVGDARHDRGRIAAADDESNATAGQLPVEGDEALAKETKSGGRLEVPPREQDRVEHEQAGHSAARGRVAKRRKIGHPQVAPEPDERRWHDDSLSARV